jgi:hypothetical protein
MEIKKERDSMSWAGHLATLGLALAAVVALGQMIAGAVAGLLP